MKLGVTRHGPFAPVVFQFGKYDIFTSTGAPTRSTSNATRSSPITTLLTRAGVTDRRGASTTTVVPKAMRPSASDWPGRGRATARGQLAGPVAASGTSHAERWR